MKRFLRRSGGRAPAGEIEGFGQSLFEDVVFLWRFRKCRLSRVSWRAPSHVAAAEIEEDPIIARFGDATIAVADVEGRQWIARENDFYGPTRHAMPSSRPPMTGS